VVGECPARGYGRINGLPREDSAIKRRRRIWPACTWRGKAACIYRSEISIQPHTPNQLRYVNLGGIHAIIYYIGMLVLLCSPYSSQNPKFPYQQRKRERVDIRNISNNLIIRHGARRREAVSIVSTSTSTSPSAVRIYDWMA
jgi:hypothetical protein